MRRSNTQLEGKTEGLELYCSWHQFQRPVHDVGQLLSGTCMRDVSMTNHTRDGNRLIGVRRVHTVLSSTELWYLTTLSRAHDFNDNNDNEFICRILGL